MKLEVSLYILDIHDNNFELHHQLSFPCSLEARVHGFPPDFHSYDQILYSIISEYGNIISYTQNNDTKSTWILEDDHKIICEVLWIHSLEDPYDLRFHDDADIEASI